MAGVYPMNGHFVNDQEWQDSSTVIRHALASMPLTGAT